MHLALDHLVVAAPTLDAGVAWVDARLGVAMAGGGAHRKFATHNRLLRLADCYLEAIARDPAAMPTRARWFGLDGPRWAADASTAPAILTWVVRTDDLGAALALRDTGARAVDARRGDLVWRIGVADDGALPLGGAYPTFIAWPDGEGPVRAMPDSGCRLLALRVAHPEADRIAEALRGLSDPRVTIESGPLSLQATIETPRGEATLGGEQPNRFLVE